MQRFFWLVFLSCSWQLMATELIVKVTDAKHKPLPFTVIELVNSNYPASPMPEAVQVIQKDLNFQPFVSIVPQGSIVEFPNLDKTRHHVYSFSKAKTFELRLYAGKPEAPLLFDQAGVVTLGCNIHDNMLAYIYVSNSRYIAITDADGEVNFRDLPVTDFQLTLWHPWQKQALQPEQINLSADRQYKEINLDIIQQALPKAPGKGFGDY